MMKKWRSLVVFSIMILIMLSSTFPVPADDSSTEIQVLPQTQNVSPGENFTVNINITPAQPIRGVEFKLSFNPSLLHADSVTEGNLFDGYNTLFNSGTIDNENGVITQVYSAILGKGNTSTPGTFATIGFTAIQTGNSPLHLFDVRITNETDYVTVTINDGIVKILIAGNNPPMFSSETPSNGAANVPVSTSLLEIIIEDPEGDEFSWSIETSPDVGNSNGVGDNGTKTCSVSNLKYDTTYTWYLNASDTGSGGWVNETYSFTTKSSANGDSNGDGLPPDDHEENDNTSKQQIEHLFNLTLPLNFFVNDTDGDGKPDQFTDPNHILNAVRFVNISNNTTVLLSVNNSLDQLCMWNIEDDMITLVSHNIGVITSETTDTSNDTITLTANITKTNWTYIEVTDRHPDITNLTVRTKDKRIISSELIWRENKTIYVLDDPATTYLFDYHYTILPPRFNPEDKTTFNTSTPTIAVTYNENVSITTATINEAPTSLTSLDNTTFTYAPETNLSNGNYILSITVQDDEDNSRTDTAVYTISVEKPEELLPSEGIPWMLIAIIGTVIIIIAVIVYLYKKEYF